MKCGALQAPTAVAVEQYDKIEYALRVSNPILPLSINAESKPSGKGV